VDELLQVAIELTRILGELHKQGVVHKDFKPDNVLYNERTRKLQLIDFGISTRAGLDHSTPRTAHHGRDHRSKEREGTFAYMSPEQTGRMSRAVDYRTGTTHSFLTPAHVRVK
jgi:serine/threonine protein kinase